MHSTSQPDLPHNAARGREDVADAVDAIYRSRSLGRHRAIQVVALRLAHHINRESGWTFVSQDSLADALGVRKLTVQRALQSLTGEGVEGDSHRPRLDRPYFAREVVPLGRNRSLTFHCLIRPSGGERELDRAGRGKPIGRGEGNVLFPPGTRSGGERGQDRAGRGRPELSNPLTVREEGLESDSGDPAPADADPVAVLVDGFDFAEPPW